MAGNKIPAEVGAKVIEGGRAVCNQAGIPLAGGHSIDAPELLFGLAVTGIADRCELKANSDAKAGDKLHLTKPLGIGIITTAEKKKKIEGNDLNIAVDAMCQLNSIGAKPSKIFGVNCMTDITGFWSGRAFVRGMSSKWTSGSVKYAKPTASWKSCVLSNFRLCSRGT